MTDAASVAIVTGGAQGIGAAICKTLLKQGGKVCVADVQADKGKRLAEELQEEYGSENVIFSNCDVRKEDDYTSAFEATLEAFGKVDILVNNAGIASEIDPLNILQVNLMGPIIGCQKALKYMGTSNGGKGGVVINTASILGLVPAPFAPVYAATKHGIVGLTRSYGLPFHLEKNGILFAALCPSFTDTEIVKSSKTSSTPRYKFSQLPELMSAEYVAKGVLKILEDRINGSTLLVTKKNGFQYIGYESEFSDFRL